MIRSAWSGAPTPTYPCRAARRSLSRFDSSPHNPASSVRHSQSAGASVVAPVRSISTEPRKSGLGRHTLKQTCDTFIWAPLREDGERAVYWLSAATKRGFINYPFLAHHDPFLKKVHAYQPFDQLLQQVRKRWEAFEP